MSGEKTGEEIETHGLSVEEQVDTVEWVIVQSIGPKMNGLPSDIVLAGMAQAMTRIAMTANGIDQREAVQLIRSMFVAKPS